jgi:ankyrin repeat protein
MKLCFLIIVALGLLVGCGRRPQSDFEQAGQAIYHRNTNALAAILARNRGVVTNVSGFDASTLLHYTLANLPDIACSELLVNAGADVNRRDCTGATPLHVACKHGTRPEAISFLIKHGADVTMRDGQGQTPLQIATRPGFGHSSEGVALLKAAVGGDRP